MISVVQNSDIYEIRFPYDPAIIELVKNVPGRAWNPENKFWSIPLARLGFLIAQFKGTPYEKQVDILSCEDIGVNASIDEPNKIPDVPLDDFSYRIAKGSYPFKHQIDSLKFAKWRYENGLTSGFLLADQPGCGKTLQVYNIAEYFRETHNSAHCLIIACVNSAKYNWVADIEKHSNNTEHPYLIGSRLKRDGGLSSTTSGKEKLEDLTSLKMYNKEVDLPHYLVINVEAIRYKVKNKFPIADRIAELIASGYIDIIALDEIHRNCSMTSQQGKRLLEIKKKCASSKVQWIPLTGTPITSKPTDVFLPLRLVDGHTFSSFYTWCQQFCIYGGFGGHEIIGYKNIPNLKNMLQPNMLRRLKKNILDLPPKLYYTEYIENSEYQRKLYNKLNEELHSDKESIRRSLNPASYFIKLRQVNGSPELVDSTLKLESKNYLSCNAKLARLMELLDDVLADPDEKVVIFSNWVEPLRTLHKFVKTKYKVCCYTGTMKAAAREQHKHTFITDPRYRVMIGTVGALGVSHTLTVARNVIFYDEPWNPADKEQCEDRCHRPGTVNTVNIYTLITKDTVDEVVHNILDKKEGTSQYIVDNALDIHNHPELIELMLREKG